MEREITSIEKNKDSLIITLNDGEFATLYKWGEKDIYSVVSDNLNKKVIDEFKRDVIASDWNDSKLRDLWIKVCESKNK